jgi:L-ascorbate metabolism protein UlaG (beta-lactamase superfamily)
MTPWIRYAVLVATLVWILPLQSTPVPTHVDMTWMSIANMYYEIGELKILTDGYFSRVPQSEFYGGGGGLAHTHDPYKPDVAAVTRVMEALGGASSVNLLLTGHSHFDHSFDTATWSRLTGARIIGPMTTCYQAMAENIAANRCTAVYGGERLTLADGVTMRIVRWNHSGDSATNPEQHNPVELTAIPMLDPTTGGLHTGVAEDFPNGGGTRGFLFTVDSPQGRFSWYYQNSASASDLSDSIVIDGKNYGAPLENLKAAMKDAGLDSVDLWIGTGGAPIAQLVAPVLKPKIYLPVHWDGLWGAFQAGIPSAFSDAALERYLSQSNIRLIKPDQYMDKWRLDRNGMQPIANTGVKRALGFSDAAGTLR